MTARKITVLVVEDEPLVRINIVSTLEDEGFLVMDAGNAQEAMGILADSPVVNVLFTDVDMPGAVDGLELARMVKERHPPIQVIVTSGHRNVVDSDLPADGQFMPKPYIPENVVRAILALTGEA